MEGSVIVSDEEMLNKYTTLQHDYEIKKKEWVIAEDRYISQLNFSKEANENLKNDYDLLQEKFEDYMRSNNQINQSLKDEVDILNRKKEVLAFQLEDFKLDTKSKIEDMNEDFAKRESNWKEEMQEKTLKLNLVEMELNNLKAEINIKLTKLKLQELEMHRKNQEFEERMQVSSGKNGGIPIDTTFDRRI